MIITYSQIDTELGLTLYYHGTKTIGLSEIMSEFVRVLTTLDLITIAISIVHVQAHLKITSLKSVNTSTVPSTTPSEGFSSSQYQTLTPSRQMDIIT